MKHTPEPWIKSHHANGVPYIFSASNYQNIAAMMDGDNDDENALRIVACVNACVGLDTEKLEDGLDNAIGINLIAYDEKIFELTKQRDELLAALKYHQAQTRPIIQTLDIIAKLEAQS